MGGNQGQWAQGVWLDEIKMAQGSVKKEALRVENLNIFKMSPLPCPGDLCQDEMQSL